jgi:hypothetical protein
VRERSEIERLLSRAYRKDFIADRLVSGLRTVAAALNANDPGLARIAAVHLCLPDLPDRAARDGMEAEDRFIKYARDESGSDWNPVLHPRTGTPPNPGWFAPTDGGGGESSPVRTAANDDLKVRSDASPVSDNNWVRLAPGPKRIDELADFVEWMANAKPEDEQAIRAEIKRYFYEAGDQGSAAALNSALTVLLRPGLTKQDRQRLLDSLDVFTRVDPAEYVHNRDWTTAAALLGGGVPPVPAAEGATAEGAAAAAEETATGAASDVWKYGWAKRGSEIHEQLSDGSLGPKFPTIDMIPNGVATSIKSVDLNAATYQDAARLTYRLNKYINDLAEFDGATWGTDVVKSSDITCRTLKISGAKRKHHQCSTRCHCCRTRAGSIDKLHSYQSHPNRILGQIMLFQSYLRRGIVYVPTTARRGSTVYTAIDPVSVVPVTNTEALRRALAGAIARGNAAVPLIKGKRPPPVVLKYAGVRTWSAFARDASTWNIEENQGAYQIVGHRMHPDGYWVEDPDQKIEFPPGATVDAVIDRMIAILQGAAQQ